MAPRKEVLRRCGTDDKEKVPLDHATIFWRSIPVYKVLLMRELGRAGKSGREIGKLVERSNARVIPRSCHLMRPLFVLWRLLVFSDSYVLGRRSV